MQRQRYIGALTESLIDQFSSSPDCKAYLGRIVQAHTDASVEYVIGEFAKGAARETKPTTATYCFEGIVETGDVFPRQVKAYIPVILAETLNTHSGNELFSKSDLAYEIGLLDRIVSERKFLLNAPELGTALAKLYIREHSGIAHEAAHRLSARVIRKSPSNRAEIFGYVKQNLETIGPDAYDSAEALLAMVYSTGDSRRSQVFEVAHDIANRNGIAIVEEVEGLRFRIQEHNARRKRNAIISVQPSWKTCVL